ncbi:type II toxin-antitoxin system RelE/ParE family toxin [Mesorhizobium sp. M1329]|uniref:type II toxin-antitoxin system RelE/ParE family toxin n=1 Tax=Mesorhizobium sp. M1329 TaxID=2957083 RepID=UPI003337729B
MRRANVTYRPQAIADLQGIYRVIAEASQSDGVAAGFVQRIMARCRKIGDAPNGGRPRDDLEPGLRTVPFERTAIIAYRATDNVEITNVFYGGRDYEALYHAGEPD